MNSTLDVLRAQPPADAVEEQPVISLSCSSVKRAEDDDLVDPVEELGPEVPRSTSMSSSFSSLEGLVAPRVRLDPVGAEVAGHDHDGVLEVDRAALGVGEAAVVEQLQQDVEDIGVRLLDLVEQQHRVRLASHRLGQLPGLLVADVARAGRRRAG